MADRDDDHWARVEARRREFLALAVSLDEAQLDTPSLCDGWRVRDVLGHVVWLATTAPPELVREVILAGGRTDRALDATAKVIGSLPTSDVVRQLEGGVTSRLVAPTVTPAALAADLLVHLQDVRRPLDIEGVVDPAEATQALDTYLATNRFVGGRRRAKGLTLRADDHDWSSGRGAEVRGPAEALLLAVTGRGSAVAAELTGDGAAVLLSR